MQPHNPHTLKFSVKQTSKGYLGQGIEIPAIIIESATKEQLMNDLGIAVDCYFKSFPEEHDKIFEKESVEIEQIPVTI